MKSNLVFKIVDKLAKSFGYQVSKNINHCKNLKKFSLTDSELIRINDQNVFSCSKGIYSNNKFPAGKYIDITTDAKKITVNIIFKERANLKNMTLIATSGVDIYEKSQDWTWIKSIVPNHQWNMNVVDTIEFNSKKKKNLRFYMPLFSSVARFEIYVKPDECIELLQETNKTILIYGSSISQGCAASRPGLSYSNILSRMVDFDVLNYGFSESCRGEDEIIEYIANKNANIYVIEYDHNSPIDEFRLKHKNVYLRIREKNKSSLIIFISRISGGISISNTECSIRNEIIQSTVDFAINNGDKNVVYINGSNLLPEHKEIYLTDDRHPNDFGMFEIASSIKKVIKNKEINY